MRQRSIKEESVTVSSANPAVEVAEDLATGLVDGPHQLEQAVQRCLLADVSLNFSSLVVHRIPDGICLEGTVEVDDGCSDVCCLVRQVAGVNEVLNHLVVHHKHHPPAKG